MLALLKPLPRCAAFGDHAISAWIAEASTVTGAGIIRERRHAFNKQRGSWRANGNRGSPVNDLLTNTA